MHCLKVAAADPTPTAPALSTAAAETPHQSVAACASPSPAGVSLLPSGASRQLSAEAELVSVVHHLDVFVVHPLDASASHLLNIS